MSSVAVTGIGLLHPHGRTLRAIARALRSGRTPDSARIEHLGYDGYFPDGPPAKKMDRAGKFACCSALQALHNAGFEQLPDPDRTGLAAGTAFGVAESCVGYHTRLVSDGPDFMNPAVFPNTAHNVPAGEAAIRLGIRGPFVTFASGLIAGHDALIAGTRMILAGKADMVIAGGFDRWIPELEKALTDLRALPPRGSSEPGLVPAEAACFLVLESEAHARRRGALPLTSILGYGLASDPIAAGSVHPRGRALTVAASQALRRAGVDRPAGLCLGVQGSRRYDTAIRAAYDRLFDGIAGPLPSLSPKNALGETFGAAGPLAVAALLSGAGPEALHRGPVLVDGLAWGGGAAALLLGPTSPSSLPGRRRGHG